MTIPQTLPQQLQNEDHNVRSQAVLALGQVDHADALPLLVARLQVETEVAVREDITYTLARIGQPAVYALVPLLSDKRADVRHHAAHTLGKIGDPHAVEPLIAALTDTEPRVVSKVVFVLGQIGDVRALPALVALLGHDDQDVQSTLATTLSGFGQVAITHLIPATTHADWRVREEAVTLLGDIGDESIIPTLATTLNDDNVQVRMAAVMALGQIGGVQAHDVLQRAQHDPSPQVSAIARRLSTTR